VCGKVRRSPLGRPDVAGDGVKPNQEAALDDGFGVFPDVRFEKHDGLSILALLGEQRGLLDRRGPDAPRRSRMPSAPGAKRRAPSAKPPQERAFGRAGGGV
jgi:hypothetical protein